MLCGQSVVPELTIKNQGSTVLTSVTVNYSFDGGSTQTYNWTGSLNSEETTSISLPQSSLNIGLHNLDIETTTTNDAYDTNNTLSQSFILNDASENPTQINSFENIDDALLTHNKNSEDSLWEIAEPNKTLLDTTGSGILAYVTGAAGNYPHNTTAYLYTNCYDLTQISSPVLSFKMAFDIEQNWDYLLVEYSIDGGGSWQILGLASDPNWYNSSSTANGIPGSQWTGEGEDTNPLGGNNATVHEYSYDLAAFNTESSMLLRFVFKSDQAVSGEGVMIDDLVITGTLTTSDYDFSNRVSIYPNPSDSIFNIEWPNYENTSITVFNYLGQKILEQNNIFSNKFELNMQQRSRGIYVVKIKSSSGIATKKIILE